MNNVKDSLPQFIGDFYTQKFGIVELANKKVGALVCGVTAFCDTDRRVRLFGELAGLCSCELYAGGGGAGGGGGGFWEGVKNRPPTTFEFCRPPAGKSSPPTSIPQLPLSSVTVAPTRHFTTVPSPPPPLPTQL